MLSDFIAMIIPYLPHLICLIFIYFLCKSDFFLPFFTVLIILAIVILLLFLYVKFSEKTIILLALTSIIYTILLYLKSIFVQHMPYENKMKDSNTKNLLKFSWSNLITVGLFCISSVIAYLAYMFPIFKNQLTINILTPFSFTIIILLEAIKDIIETKNKNAEIKDKKNVENQAKKIDEV